MDPARPLYLCGPTASGKSSLAIELARALDGEIVNADAFQLYRGLPVLTAAPSPAELDAVPHHLYAVLDPDQTCDAMHYRRLALPVLREIIDRGKTPIVTGGSGLYLKFLTHGPSPLPSGDPAIRARLDPLPLDELVALLRRLDPVEAARTALHNRRYVTRAIEICQLAGRPASELRDRWQAAAAETDSRLRGLYLQRQRPDLHRRIAGRTLAMLENGAIEEVAALTGASDTFDKTIGFREIRDLLAGRSDRARCAELITIATRRYAKRQETWFRRERWLRPLLCPPGAPPAVADALALPGIRL